MPVHVSTLVDHTHKKFLRCLRCKYESTPFWFWTDRQGMFHCPICNCDVEMIPWLSEDAPKMWVESGSGDDKKVTVLR